MSKFVDIVVNDALLNSLPISLPMSLPNSLSTSLSKRTVRKAAKNQKSWTLYKHSKTKKQFWVHIFKSNVYIWNYLSDFCNDKPQLVMPEKEFKLAYSSVQEIQALVVQKTLKHVQYVATVVRKAWVLSLVHPILEENLGDRKMWVAFTSTCKSSRRHYKPFYSNNDLCKLPRDLVGDIFGFLGAKHVGCISQCSKKTKVFAGDIIGINQKTICKIPNLDEIKINIWGSLNFLVAHGLADLVVKYLPFPDISSLFSVNSFTQLRLFAMRSVPGTTKISMLDYQCSVRTPNKISYFLPKITYFPAKQDAKNELRTFGEYVLCDGFRYYKKDVLLKVTITPPEIQVKPQTFYTPSKRQRLGKLLPYYCDDDDDDDDDESY